MSAPEMRLAVDMHCTDATKLQDDGIVAATIRIDLSWLAEDPHAAIVTFTVNHASTVWLMDIDLIADGLTAPAGDGDVYIKPDPDDFWSILLELENQNGHALFRIPAQFLSEFVAAVDDAREKLPPVELDWSGALAKWMEESL